MKVALQHLGLTYHFFKVEHLIDNTTKEWNTNIISTLFDQGTTEKILKTPLVQ
jgi:hypothetical protein